MILQVNDDLSDRVEALFDTTPKYSSWFVKGRFGLDFPRHPRRFKTPLSRSGGPGEFPELTWKEALSLDARGAIRDVTRRGL